MTPRELAAAIRKGAAIRPQCRGKLFKGGGSCALGAAYEGIFGVLYGSENGAYQKLCKTFPILEGEIVDGRQLYLTIATKNDSGMTREAIADWLDTLEPETKPADKQSFDAFMATVMKPVPVNSLVFHSD